MVFEFVFVVVVLGLINYGLYRFLYYSWEEGKPLQYKNVDKLNGKTVLITGANCGLGKATAYDLADRGARVILACRDRERAEAAAEDIKRGTGNEDVSVVILDLSDLDSVKAAADAVLEKYDRLDILINNAGIGLNDEKVTKQGFDMIFGTNHLGHYLFTQLLLDLLKKSAPSRIINVSSEALWAVWGKLDYQPISEDGTTKFPKLQGYPISKLANYYHAMALAEELNGTRVTANAIHPGMVKTQIANRVCANKLKVFLNKIFSGLSTMFGRSAKYGCQTIVYMAVDPTLVSVTGKYFANMKYAPERLSKLARDKEEWDKLSKFSYEMCQDYLPAKPSVDKDTTIEKMEGRKDDKPEMKAESLSIKQIIEMKPEEIRPFSLETCVEESEGESPSASLNKPRAEFIVAKEDPVFPPSPLDEPIWKPVVAN